MELKRKKMADVSIGEPQAVSLSTQEQPAVSVALVSEACGMVR